MAQPTLSEIIEAIGDLLTEEQKGALVTTLLDGREHHVQPGDLITAGLFNQMLGDISDLVVRVAALEGAVDPTARMPVITDILPAGARTGEEITLIGQNLTPELLSLVKINDSDIPVGNLKPGSAATRLIFDIPAVTGVSTTGTLVDFRVANGAGSATRSYLLRAATTNVLVSGFAFSLAGITPAGNIAANTNYQFKFNVTASASRPETFTVEPILSPATAGWTATMANGNTEVSIPQTEQGQSVTREVTVNVHSGGAGTTNLSLKVRGKTVATAGGDSGDTPIAINAAAPEPVPDITFGTVRKAVFNSKVSVSGSKIYFNAITKGTRIVIIFPVTITTAGTYNINQPNVSQVAGWAAPELDMSPTAKVITVLPNTPNQTDVRVALTFEGEFDAANPTQFDRQITIPIIGSGQLSKADQILQIKVRKSEISPDPA
jgi:hypothetical protein